MLISMSDYLANKLWDHALGGPDYARPATVYVRLYTVLPGADGVGGTEVTGTSYAPLAIVNDLTKWLAAATRTKKTKVVFDFGTAGGDWSSGAAIVGAAIWDAAAAGNMLVRGDFSLSRTVLSGQPFAIAAEAGVFVIQ